MAGPGRLVTGWKCVEDTVSTRPLAAMQAPLAVCVPGPGHVHDDLGALGTGGEAYFHMSPVLGSQPGANQLLLLAALQFAVRVRSYVHASRKTCMWGTCTDGQPAPAVPGGVNMRTHVPVPGGTRRGPRGLAPWAPGTEPQPPGWSPGRSSGGPRVVPGWSRPESPLKKGSRPLGWSPNRFNSLVMVFRYNRTRKKRTPPGPVFTVTDVGSHRYFEF